MFLLRRMAGATAGKTHLELSREEKQPLLLSFRQLPLIQRIDELIYGSGLFLAPVAHFEPFLKVFKNLCRIPRLAHFFIISGESRDPWNQVPKNHVPLKGNFLYKNESGTWLVTPSVPDVIYSAELVYPRHSSNDNKLSL